MGGRHECPRRRRAPSSSVPAAKALGGASRFKGARPAAAAAAPPRYLPSMLFGLAAPVEDYPQPRRDSAHEAHLTIWSCTKAQTHSNIPDPPPPPTRPSLYRPPPLPLRERALLARAVPSVCCRACTQPLQIHSSSSPPPPPTPNTPTPNTLPPCSDFVPAHGPCLHTAGESRRAGKAVTRRRQALLSP